MVLILYCVDSDAMMAVLDLVCHWKARQKTTAGHQQMYSTDVFGFFL